MLPNFFIIGAQKSGTTSVQKWLSEHPQIYIVPHEVAFFEDSVYNEHSIEYLESLFNHVDDQEAIGLKRPNCLAKQECPERIRRHIPNTKLIVVLRNPVERAVSGYFHYMRSGFIPIKAISEGLPEIINGHGNPRYYPAMRDVIEYGFYFQHLTRYLSYFDRNQFKILLNEDLEKNPVNSIREICTFLEIDSDFHPSSLTGYSMQGIYSISRLKFLAAFSPLYQQWNENRTRQYGKCDFFSRCIRKTITTFDSVFLSRIFPAKPPELQCELRKNLKQIYQQDIRQLQGLLGRNLKSWL